MSIKLPKLIRAPTATRRLERISEMFVNIYADDRDDPHNSFGSTDSVKNYDYYRTRNSREVSEAAEKKR